MMKLCVVETSDGNLYARENEQRLLRNMGVHVVVLDLLKIPYDKVGKADQTKLVMFIFHCVLFFADGRYANESHHEISA